MKIIVACVGKKHDAALAVAIDEYVSRINRAIALTWEFLPPSGAEESRARKEESLALLERTRSSDVVWLLDERGEQLSSPELAARINVLQYQSVPRLVLLIGGAYGVDATVHARANFVWSVSKLVFPHQMMRLIVAEQLYRATEINRGSGYHHA